MRAERGKIPASTDYPPDRLTGCQEVRCLNGCLVSKSKNLISCAPAPRGDTSIRAPHDRVRARRRPTRAPPPSSPPIPPRADADPAGVRQFGSRGYSASSSSAPSSAAFNPTPPRTLPRKDTSIRAPHHRRRQRRQPRTPPPPSPVPPDSPDLAGHDDRGARRRRPSVLAAAAAALPSIARAMCVVIRGNWSSREAFRPRMPVYFRCVQEKSFFKVDRHVVPF